MSGCINGGGIANYNQSNDNPSFHGNSLASNGNRWIPRKKVESLHCENLGNLRNYSGECNDPSGRGPYSAFLKSNTGINNTSVRLNHHKQMDRPSSGGKVKLCRDGQKCTSAGCNYSHEYIQKPCRFGNECFRNDKCLFFHDSLNGLPKNDGGRA